MSNIYEKASKHLTQEESLSLPKSNTQGLFVSLILGIVGWIFLLLPLYTLITQIFIYMGTWPLSLLMLICLAASGILFTLGLYRGFQELRKNNTVIDKLPPALMVNIMGLSAFFAIILTNIWGWDKIMEIVLSIFFPEII